VPLPVRKPQDAENGRAVQAHRQCDRYDDASTEWLPAASRSLYCVQYRGGFSGIDNDASTIVVNQNPDVIVLKSRNTDKIHTLPLIAWRVF
jgi:hypothetical protein